MWTWTCTLAVCKLCWRIACFPVSLPIIRLWQYLIMLTCEMNQSAKLVDSLMYCKFSPFQRGYVPTARLPRTPESRSIRGGRWVKGKDMFVRVECTNNTFLSFYQIRCARKEIADLLTSINCSHRQQGCPWEGRLEELEKHLNECQFAPAICPHCRLIMPQHKMGCPKAPVKCPFANFGCNHAQEVRFIIILE